MTAHEDKPWWDRDRFAARRSFLEARARIVIALRHWFAEQSFIEVETPALQVSPGMEPHLRPFATDIVTPEGETFSRYLHTSPEFSMKKLLVAGLPRIFQIAHVFRNGERATLHAPEFTMLEWYRAEASYERVMADCESLVKAACIAAGTDKLVFSGGAASPVEPFERLSVAEAFFRHTAIDILATAPDPDTPSISLLSVQAKANGITPHPEDSWEDLFFRIMLDRIEPHLGAGRPTILFDYPVSLAALARRKPTDPRLAERFELYICGVEVANAFGELTDPIVQRTRFDADIALRERLYGDRLPIDEDFLGALEHGMPESSGVALGLDRLVMLATGAPTIEAITWVPVR